MSFGEAEAVGSDDYAVLQQDVVADAAVFPDHGVRVREEIAADLHSPVDDHVREQLAAWSPISTFSSTTT